jgi:pyruvate ferredoxin oxidoreductase gamma subunit
MQQMTEVRWHGRGGQGAKTAALLFAEAALEQGKHCQAFPEYGPERTGAPVKAFDRISEDPIYLHCDVKAPQLVVVLDATLMREVDVTEGLSENGRVIVNTHRSPADVAKQLGLPAERVFTLDASGISLATIQRNIPNTPMLGALAKLTGMLDFERLMEETKHKLEKKFARKPEVIEGNLAAMRRGYEEVAGA